MSFFQRARDWAEGRKYYNESFGIFVIISGLCATFYTLAYLFSDPAYLLIAVPAWIVTLWAYRDFLRGVTF